MIKSAWVLGSAAVLIAVTFLSYRHFTKVEPVGLKAPSITNMKAQTYWTCAMHPQIHSEHPGECPICHMRLIQVKSGANQMGRDEEADRRATVTASPYELKLLGVQKILVEKMDLNAEIPISGRFISASQIAFQAYESDLRYIKPGLVFRATSAYLPDKDVSGKITSVDTIADPTSRTVRVLGQITKGPRSMISETTFSGDLEVPLKAVVAIPESSVLHAGKADLVYVVEKNGNLKSTPVKLGLKTETYFEVREGLSAGESISSGPNFLIDSEARISAAYSPSDNEPKESKPPSCPPGQHWDIPMSMCMPGKK